MSRKVMNCAVLAVLLLAGCEVSDAPVPAPAPSSPPVSSAKSPAPSLFPSTGTSTSSAQHHGLSFVSGFESGYAKAMAAGKPMLVFFTAEWCHFCHQMADEAFRNPQVVGLADRFVCILVDADAEPEVCSKFRVQGYPTVQFLSPRGVPLNRLVGKKPSEQVMTAMQAALQNVARSQETAAETTTR